MSQNPSYRRVYLTFIRNSLVRELMFPANFLIEAFTTLCWVTMNVAFYLLIFEFTQYIGDPSVEGSVWNEYQFFAFIATTMFINSIVQMAFMVNADEFSEMIRTGGLDFALLKPIDTQFLVSLRKIDWSSLANFAVAAILLAYSVPRIEGFTPSLWQVALYPLYILAGVGILYSVMITLAATSVWLGRNQSLYDFWFYITTFSRYPMEIYSGPIGLALRWAFTFILPILIVSNVPARLIAKPMQPEHAYLALFAIVATIASLAASRWIFNRALLSYRSASS